MYEREYKWRLTMKRMRIESEKISQLLVECKFLICHNVFKWNILYDVVGIKIEVNMCMKGNTNED